MYFFKDGQNLNFNKLPKALNTKEIKQAMKTLQYFSEDEKARLLYIERVEREREELTIQRSIEKTKAELAKSQEKLLKTREEALKSKEEISKKNILINTLEDQIQQNEQQIQYLVKTLTNAGIQLDKKFA